MKRGEFNAALGVPALRSLFTRSLFMVVAGVFLTTLCASASGPDNQEVKWIDGFPYVLREHGEKSYLEVSLPKDMMMVSPKEGVDPFDGYQYPLDENGMIVVPDEAEVNGTVYPVKAIDIWSIRYQREAKGVKLGNNMKYLRHGNFSHFPKATTVNLGQVEWIESDCVSDMPMLDNLTINIPIKSLGSSFCRLGLKEFEFPVWMSTFSYSEYNPDVPEEYVIDYDIRYNEMEFLASWPNLKKLDLSGLTKMPFEAFHNFDNVEEVRMPECMQESGYAIVDMPALKTIWLSKVYDFTIDYQYNYDVSGVPNVGTVYSPCETAPYFDYSGGPMQTDCEEQPVYTFGNNSIDTEKCIVYVPEGCVEIYRSCPSWEAFSNILEYDFENNVPISGISDISLSGENKAVYYNAQGMEIRDISTYKGLYIERIPGAKKNASRIMVK